MTSLLDLLRENYGILWGGRPPKDIAEVIDTLAEDARNGDVDVQGCLGYIYSDRRLVEQSDSEATKWYLMAAEAGNASAQYNCGHAYRYGLGVPKDAKAAVTWFLKAARQGDAESQFIVAMYGLTGGEQWTEFDTEEKRLTHEAQFDRLWTHEERKESTSMIFRAAERRHAEAQFEVGRAFEDGCVVEIGVLVKDLARAREWYRKAAEGPAHAAKALARLDLAGSSGSA